MRTKYSSIFKSSLIFLFLAVVVCLGTKAAADTVSFHSARDCNNDAIISCGSLTTSQLVGAYQASSYTQKVYTYLGVTGADIKNMPQTAAAGHVDTRGNIYLNDHTSPVAQGATTTGRKNVTGSKQVSSQGVTFYIRPLSLEPNTTSSDAFVVMSKGSFNFAILASNGDPIIAKPVVLATPKRPVPAPAPAPVAMPSTPSAAVAPPAQLINTGPMNAKAAVFVAASVITATLAAYRFQLRKLEAED